MKRRFRLSQTERELLGFKEMKTNQYSLNEEQTQLLLEERNGFSDETTGYRRRVTPELVMSAVSEEGTIMPIEEYCVKYGLDFATVRSYRLMNHLTPARYSIVFHSTEEEGEAEDFDLKEVLEKDFKRLSYKKKSAKGRGVAVCTIGDLHLGAYIDGLRNTPDYSIDILVKRLGKIADKLNAGNYKKVHVHILGDLIESFSGLNHKNSWKGLSKGMNGAEVIKFTTKVLHKFFLSRIKNLQDVKIVGGNHDRFSHDKSIDNEGGAADVIAWGLSLVGYDVEFDSMVINHVVDGVSYILLHGDKGISKRKAKEIIFDYGKQGLYNVIEEAHLHSLIVKEDSHNCVRFHVRSLFTGNAYSEELGFTSTAGFTVFTQEKGNSAPDMLNYSLK